MLHVFQENSGILTTELAVQYGINDSTLRKAAERNDIQRYNRGIYLLDDVYYDDLFLLQLRYTKGIYSHDTALMLHELTTYSPFSYHISFPKGYHLKSAKENNIKAYYVCKKALDDTYVETIASWESNLIRVTTLEKTVVDVLRSERIMTFLVKEMIESYVEREDKDIEKLIDYAKEVDVLEVVRKEVLPLVK